MTREEQTIANLKKLKSFHNGSYGMDIDRAIKALEQESKSEWEQDHEILKAYSDGANEVLDKIRAEIEQAADKQFQIIAMGVSDFNERYAHIQMENAYRHSLQIIDKYKGESEG